MGPVAVTVSPVQEEMKRAQTEYEAMGTMAPIVLQFVTMIRPENKLMMAKMA